MRRLADVVDAALEAPIAPSFTRVGYETRRRLDHWVPVDRYDLHGRVVVITGATSGLGLAAARILARDGATIELVARDVAKADAACIDLRIDAGHPRVGYVIADLADLHEVRRAATVLGSRHAAIDVLVHNAGALDASYETVAGTERTVASQVLGPFLLTGLLLGPLRAAAPARVLFVSSGGMYSQRLSVDDLEMAADRYDGTTAYARAKRAQVTLAELWAERLRADDVVVHSLHPGWADTPGVARSLPTFRRVVGPFLRTPDQGVDTLVWLAADDGEPLRSTGRFWHDRRPRSTHRIPATRRTDTPDERARLWAWCAERTGWTPDAVEHQRR